MKEKRNKDAYNGTITNITHPYKKLWKPLTKIKSHKMLIAPIATNGARYRPVLKNRKKCACEIHLSNVYIAAHIEVRYNHIKVNEKQKFCG